MTTRRPITKDGDKKHLRSTVIAADKSTVASQYTAADTHRRKIQMLGHRYRDTDTNTSARITNSNVKTDDSNQQPLILPESTRKTTAGQYAIVGVRRIRVLIRNLFVAAPTPVLFIRCTLSLSPATFRTIPLSVPIHQHQKGAEWAERLKILWRVEARSLGSCCVICIVSGRCVNVTLCGQLSDLFTFSIEFALHYAEVEHFNYTRHQSKATHSLN